MTLELTRDEAIDLRNQLAVRVSDLRDAYQPLCAEEARKLQILIDRINAELEK